MINELQFTAYVKYIEYLLHKLTEAAPDVTVKEIQNGFKDKFGTDIPALNSQYFGIVRLLPLLFIRENLIKGKNKDICRKLTIIRHALAHNQVECDDKGFTFECDKGTKFFSYEDIVDFCQKTEREFFGV